MTANDAYSRLTGLGSVDDQVLDQSALLLVKLMKRVTARCPGCAVVILVPLARPDGELRGVAWEKTAAFHLERRTMKASRNQAGITSVKYVILGRCLTKKQNGRHAITEGCSEWYQPDGVHLSDAGYRKLADAIHLPVWIKFARV